MAFVLIANLRAWWRRHILHQVEPPPLQYGRTGTKWHEHNRHSIGFSCPCGLVMAFSPNDLVIRDRDHVTDCPGDTCSCPIIDARFVKHCINCRRGHWKDASPEKRKHGT